jgi:hypothetical protein
MQLRRDGLTRPAPLRVEVEHDGARRGGDNLAQLLLSLDLVHHFCCGWG